MTEVIVVAYTTRYRKGGPQFQIVAETLAEERKEAALGDEVVARAVESKREFLRIFAETKASGKRIKELHFVGHSGMYGPMFGTVAFPEQFSPYEWETMEIPFADGATAYFHCCRSARWFAPFFARTFNIPSYGYFWYTTFSRSRSRYHRASSNGSGGPRQKLYTIGCKGRKSHGLTASLVKFVGLMPAEEMKLFQPQLPSGDVSYNKVAELYDQTFADIKVRSDEWGWIRNHLPRRRDLKVLDIGCGNGALLRELSDSIEYGAGVDESEAILERAKARASSRPHSTTKLDFWKIDSPSLPFQTATFDVVISMMSFRYLDWDPLLQEVKRVTKPGGLLLVVDMVTVPVKLREYPRLLMDKARTWLATKRKPEFSQNLRRLVNHPDWKTMLKYNPIRSEHEMRWYLESRFPGRQMQTLNIAWNSRIVAFDSGPVEIGVEANLTYP
ncbi:MAG TPA: class I SAM-dependent methyltransferase [Blastocatellia bacterium]|nr:class I SAM-dependent methyltransferase [Blastocatellia bacterium]